MSKTSEGFVGEEDIQKTFAEKDEEKYTSSFSIRVSAEDRAKFEELFKSLGLKTKGEVFRVLLTSFNVEQLKATKPGLSSEIENFQVHTSRLNEILSSVVCTLTDEKKAIVHDYDVKIQNLQQTLEDVRAQVEQYKQQSKQNEETANALKTQLEEQRSELKLKNGYLEQVDQRISDAKNAEKAAVLEAQAAREAAAAATSAENEANKRADEFLRRAETAEAEIVHLRRELDVAQTALASTKSSLEQYGQFTSGVLETLKDMGISLPPSVGKTP